MSSPTVVVLWQRFGPYHLARLRAASDVLATRGWRVFGLEVASKDEYAWQHADNIAVGWRTVFPEADYRAIGSRRIAEGVAACLHEIQPGAVCINGWAVPEAVAGLAWCRTNGRRSILMSETFEPSQNSLKEWLKRRRVRRFDAALVGGRWQADYLASLGFPSDRIQLGYDVVDNAHFSPADGHANGTRLPAISSRYILANTRFLKRKGIDALLEAYAAYHGNGDSGNPWGLVICGSGEMEAPWKALAERLGVADSVRWLGFLQYQDLPSLYAGAGVFVHPARREAWGLVVNEAAAAGLPLIVGCRVGASCELLREGENGYLVDPDDIGSFAGALRRITGLSDKDRRLMGMASRRLAGLFQPRRFGEGLLRCVEDV